MSNVTLFSSSNVPAFARNNELSDTAKALTGGGVSNSVKRISIKGGVFRLVAGGKEVASIDDRHLDVIIVKAAPKVSRIFYSSSYDADNITGPDCWSNDGERPDPSAENKQADACVSCPKNQAGSGQGNSRACRYQQRLAVVLANNPSGDVMQLTLPATSVFGKEEGDKRPLQAYARYLAAQSISPETLVTRLKFDTKAAVPKLFFQPVRWLDNEEFETVTAKGQTEDAKRAVTMTVSQADGVKPLALEGKKPEAKAVAVEAEEAVDEPEVRKEAKAKPTAVPKKAGNLASVVSDWDADDE